LLFGKRQAEDILPWFVFLGNNGDNLLDIAFIFRYFNTRMGLISFSLARSKAQKNK